MSRGKQYRLTARCPTCQAPVRLRNSGKAVELLLMALESEDWVPDDVLQTYQCARPDPHDVRVLCNEIVYIRVRHWSLVEH